MADTHGVGGPRRGEVHPGADLQDRARPEEARPGEALRVEGLGEEPGERLDLRVRQRCGCVHVEAVLGLEPLHVRPDPLARELEHGPLLGSGETGGAVQVEQAHGSLPSGRPTPRGSWVGSLPAGARGGARVLLMGR